MTSQLTNLLKAVASFKKIIVTGTQRSGTRITSKIISHDLGHDYVDEADISYYSLNRLFLHLFNDRHEVIHGPHLSSCCHLIDTPKTAIVFTFRDETAIRLSQKAINWKNEKLSLNQYFLNDGDINKVKINAWEQQQKQMLLTPYFEVHYEWLTGHPLWLDKCERSKFAWNQTAI